MRRILICLSLFLGAYLWGCTFNHNSLLNEEQNQIIKAVINIENDSSLGRINSAKYGSYYLMYDQFHDSIYLDSSMIQSIDKHIDLQGIQRLYKKAVIESNKMVSDSFNLIHLVEVSNQTPEFLSFSKPIKYSKYYFINFSYSSWASAYKSTLILVKNTSGQFTLLYRSVYSIV